MKPHAVIVEPAFVLLFSITLKGAFKGFGAVLAWTVGASVVSGLVLVLLLRGKLK